MKFVQCIWAVLLLAIGAAGAQTYPSKALRWIVTYPPGGPTDVVARAVGAKLSEAWRQQVVIDNRPGAGGIIGTELAAKAPPDGYTLLFGTSAGLCINPALSSKLPYDPVRDFAPITLVVINPQLLVTNIALPARSIKELIALAKGKPGQLNYASVGPGTPNHLGMELLKTMTGINLVHIPYKGTGPAITDLISGQVQLMFNSMPSVLSHVRTGKLRALAVGSANRSRAVPDVPTVAESGVPGFEYVTWYGLFAPARTPQDIVQKLNGALVNIVSDPEMSKWLISQGAEPAATTPPQLSRYMEEETRRWKKVIDAAHIKIQ